MQFAQVFPEQAIVVALIRQLSWTKILALIPIKNDLKRTFCVEMAQLEHWSSRQLQERISSQLFERTMLSKKPEQTIRADLEQLRQTGRVAPEMLLKDPYILDFLGLFQSDASKACCAAKSAAGSRMAVSSSSGVSVIGI
jgi:hypothetical protein